MDKNTLYKRIIVNYIEKFLNSREIIVLHGARQVGKTSIMQYLITEIRKSKPSYPVFYFDLEVPRFLDLAESGFEAFYDYLLGQGYQKGEKAYVFIDEIQYMKDPTNFLKLFHDNYTSEIKLVVSGSSSFEIKKKFKNSLAGRTVDFEIWPLTFEEFLIFKENNYQLPLEKPNFAISQELVEYYREYARFGGFPRIVLEPDILKKETYLGQIIDTYVKKDIRDLASIKNIDKFNKLIQILASQTGNLLNVYELANTCGLSRPTTEEYLYLLENTYIIKLVRPFSGNIRTELTKTPKIFMADSGMANLLASREFPEVLNGNIFETAILGDFVRKYPKHEVKYWRTTSGQEVDFVDRNENQIIPVEVKINSKKARTRHLEFFMERYSLETGRIIFLEGGKRDDKNNISFIYPWEYF